MIDPNQPTETLAQTIEAAQAAQAVATPVDMTPPSMIAENVQAATTKEEIVAAVVPAVEVAVAVASIPAHVTILQSIESDLVQIGVGVDAEAMKLIDEMKASIRQKIAALHSIL